MRGRGYSIPHQSPSKTADQYTQITDIARATQWNFRRVARGDSRVVGVTSNVGATAAATTETTLNELTLPLGLFGPNHVIHVLARGLGSGSADSRQIRVLFGDGTPGTDVVVGIISRTAGTAITSWELDCTIVNGPDGTTQVTTYHGLFTTAAVPSAAQMVVSLDAGSFDTNTTPAGRSSPEAFVLYVTGLTLDAADELSCFWLDATIYGEVPTT